MSEPVRFENVVAGLHVDLPLVMAGYDKDRLFLATHAEALRALTRREED